MPMPGNLDNEPVTNVIAVTEHVVTATVVGLVPQGFLANARATLLELSGEQVNIVAAGLTGTFTCSDSQPVEHWREWTAAALARQNVQGTVTATTRTRVVAR